eukprot:m.35019 g.35019  ORF g.35019 m.35019 type:complete len:790 (-) comp6577_c0_seq1:99-2468(-)
MLGKGGKNLTRSQMLRGAYRDQIYNSATSTSSSTTTATTTTTTGLASSAPRTLRLQPRRALRGLSISASTTPSGLQTPTSSSNLSEVSMIASTPTTPRTSTSFSQSTPLASPTPIARTSSSSSSLSSQAATKAAMVAASKLAASRATTASILHGSSSNSVMLNNSFGDSERTSLLQRRIDELEDKEIAHIAQQKKLEAELKRQEHLLQSEKEEAQRLRSQRETDAKEHAKHIAQVERQRNLFFDREKELQKELENSEKRTSESRKQNFDIVSRLEEELSIVQDEHSRAMLSASQESNQLMSINIKLRQELERVNEEVEASHFTVAALQSRIAVLESVSSSKRSAEDEGTPSKVAKHFEGSSASSPNTTITGEEESSPSAATLRKMRRLERDNRRLKQLHSGTLVLKEQYATCEAELQRCKEQLKQNTVKTEDYNELKTFYDQWSLLANAFQEHLLDRNGSAEDALSTVSDLQRDYTAIKHKAVRLEEAVKRYEVQIKSNEDEVTQLQRTVDNLKSENNRLSVDAKKNRGIKSTLKDQLHSVWDSFINVTKLSTIESTRDQILKEITKLKDENESLANQIVELKELKTIPMVNPSSTTSTTTTSSRSVAPVKMEVQEKGSNEKNFKILHLKANPVAWAKRDDLADLRKENEELKALLSTSGSSASFDVELSEKVKELEASIEQRDRKIQRLKETFGEAVTDFRNMCYELTGYKIEVIHTNRYRLRSMYGESPDDCVVFQKNAEGDLQLLDSLFVSQLDDHILECLTRQNSIPTFLSTITLNLFSKTTMAY